MEIAPEKNRFVTTVLYLPTTLPLWYVNTTSPMPFPPKSTCSGVLECGDEVSFSLGHHPLWLPSPLWGSQAMNIQGN